MSSGNKKVTVGHMISLGVLAKFCHGPIDRITQFFFDDKVAASGSWDGTPNDQPYYPAPSHGQSVIISANGLFGGDNGGVYGRAIIRMGDKDQPVNELFTTSEFTGQSEISADRGVVSVLYTNWGGKPNGYYAAPWAYQFYWGNRPQLPRFGIRAQRIHVQDGGVPQWYDEKAGIGSTFIPEGNAVPVGWKNRGTNFFNIGAGVETSGSYNNPQFQSWMDGYIESVRVTRASRYGVSDFANPSTLFPEGDADAYWGDVVTLSCFHSGSAYCAKGKTLQLNGGASITSEQHDFGTTSCKFNGSTSWVKVILDSVADQNLGDNFTIEARVYLNKFVSNAYVGNAILSCGILNYGGLDTTFGVRNSAVAYSQYETGIDPDNYGVVSRDAVSLKKWTHISYTVNSGTAYVHVDGKLVSGIYSDTDMNPVHAIRERLVSKTCGLDMPEAALDDLQLKRCADILHSEGMGVSFLWDRSKPVSELIEDICFHIDALYPQVDRRTGLLYLPLIRDDYDRDNVFVLDKSNIVKIEDYERPAQSDLFNTIIVKYNDLEAKKEMSITRSDPALLKMQGGIRAKDYNMYFFSNYQAANKAAIRLLRAATKRIRTCTAYCDRSAASLRPGDVVRMFYDAPEFEGVIMRVLGVRYGTGRDQQVTLLLSEDIYDFDASAVQTEDEPVEIPNLTGDLEPITQQRAFELPYYEMAQNLGDVEAYELTNLYPEVGYIGAAAGNPASFIDAKIHVDSGAGYEEIGAVEYSTVAVLAADIGLVNPDGSIVELAEVVDVGTIGGARIGSYFMINDECIRFDGIDIDGKVMMGRGCLDTVPAEHPAGSVMFFSDDMLEVINEQYMASETVDVKLLPNTGSQILDINDATAISVTMASRAARPYLPGNVKLNGEYFPAEVGAGEVVVTWSHRDRTQQTTGAIIDFTYGDIGPEDSVEYEVKNFDDTTDAELYDSGLVSGKTVTIPAADIVRYNRLEIKSYRDTMESFYKYAIRFRDKIEMLGNPRGAANRESYSSRIYVDDPTMSLAYPLKWAIAGGSLPSGLTLLHSGAGEAFISGIPDDAAGAYTVGIQAEDANGVVIQQFIDIPLGNINSLLHFDGADGSTTFTDQTGKTWTAFGNAQIDTARSKFGGASGLFDGNGDFISTPHHTTLNLSSGDWTIECWLYLDGSTSGNQIVVNKDGVFGSSYASYLVCVNSSLKLVVELGSGNGVISTQKITSSASISTGVWVHVAAVRSAGNILLFINGTLDSTTAITATITDGGKAVFVGNYASNVNANNMLHGSVDDLRITKGIARYTENFTPPTEPFPNPQPALVLSLTGSLPAATASTAYSSTTDLIITGVASPFSVSVISGALPSGWTATVNGNYIEVAGAGVAAGRYYFTLEVEDASANVFALPLVVVVE